MPQSIALTLTRSNAGGSLTLPAPDDVQRDPQGNATFSWTDPLKIATLQRWTVTDLNGYLSEGVDAHKNRTGAHLAVTDPGGVLVTVTWTEYDPWSGTPVGPYTVTGVVTLSGASASAGRDSFSLVAYRADYRWSRATGELEEVPA